MCYSTTQEAYRDLGLESGSENKNNDFDFSATQSQTFKTNVEKTRDETTNLDFEDLPISQIRKPHRRIRKDNSQAEFKVSSIGNIEKAIWVFNSQGRLGRFWQY